MALIGLVTIAESTSSLSMENFFALGPNKNFSDELHIVRSYFSFQSLDFRVFRDLGTVSWMKTNYIVVLVAYFYNWICIPMDLFMVDLLLDIKAQPTHLHLN